MFEKLPSNDQMQKWPISTIKYWILEKSWWYFLENWTKKLHFSKSQLMQKSLVSLNFSVFCYYLKVIRKWRSNGHLTYFNLEMPSNLKTLTICEKWSIIFADCKPNFRSSLEEFRALKWQVPLFTGGVFPVKFLQNTVVMYKVSWCILSIIFKFLVSVMIKDRFWINLNHAINNQKD